MPAGFFWLLAAQFLSGLADHAVLIVAIAYLQEQRHPLWWAPLLKFAFTWSYVLLAPVAGAWADAVRKNVLMGRMNALKALAWLGLDGWLPTTALLPAFAAVLALYALAAWCNRRIPSRPARRALPLRDWPALWPRFWRDNARLWRDPLGWLSLAV